MTIASPTVEAQPPAALARIVENAHLGPITAKRVLECMGPLVLRREELFVEADKILTLDPALPSTQDRAAESRKQIKREVRLPGETVRKELKDDFLRGGRAIDGIGHAVTDACETMEAKLEAVENYARIQEAKRKEELGATRQAILTPFGFDFSMMNLAEITEEQFAKVHQSFIAIKKADEDAAARAEQDRQVAEMQRLQEEKRLRDENTKLAKEAEAREKAEAEERAKHEAELKAQREEAARLQALADKKAADERKAREKAEAELATQKAAEAKKVAAEEAARKKAEKAPDNEKLAALARALREFPMPKVKGADAVVKGADAVSVVEHVSRELAGLATEIEEFLSELSRPSSARPTAALE